MRTMVSALLVLVAMGCSSSSGSGGSGGAAGSGGGGTAQQKCEALFSTVCDRVLECVPGEYASKSECLTDAAQVVSCETAVSVSENYPACVTELQSASCSTLFPGGALALPNICNDVILTQ